MGRTDTYSSTSESYSCAITSASSQELSIYHCRFTPISRHKSQTQAEYNTSAHSANSSLVRIRIALRQADILRNKNTTKNRSETGRRDSNNSQKSAVGDDRSEDGREGLVPGATAGKGGVKSDGEKSKGLADRGKEWLMGKMGK